MGTQVYVDMPCDWFLSRIWPRSSEDVTHFEAVFLMLTAQALRMILRGHVTAASATLAIAKCAGPQQSI